MKKIVATRNIPASNILNISIIFAYVIFGLITCNSVTVNAQVLGANYNHDPVDMNFEYIEKSRVGWVRTTPRILDFYFNNVDIETDKGLQNVIEAGKRGYNISFGFRWDFAQYNLDIPEPDSKLERELFDLQRRILNMLAPHVNQFKLGNEPNLETKRADMFPGQDGVIPLVRFTERQLDLVVLPFFKDHPEIRSPQIFIGSFPRMFLPDEQSVPAVQALIRMAHENDNITGLAVHLHISKLEQIDESFEFVRSIMPDKPIIIPEFSLHRLYLEKREEKLGNSPEGLAFCAKYGRDPELLLYQWCGIANTFRMSPQEWKDLFYSRDWFPKNYLQVYREKYKQYGVTLATFPLFQQSCPQNMRPDSPMWFINPVFSQKSLMIQEDGSFSPNPLVFEDYITWARETRDLDILKQL
jgi:hypothetical protein